MKRESGTWQRAFKKTIVHCVVCCNRGPGSVLLRKAQGRFLSHQHCISGCGDVPGNPPVDSDPVLRNTVEDVDGSPQTQSQFFPVVRPCPCSKFYRYVAAFRRGRLCKGSLPEQSP